MTRHGYTVHVRSQRRRGSFDWLERNEIYPKLRAAIEGGGNDIEIATALGISERTVARFRRREGYINPRAPKRGRAS